jgi:hypothetical protein
MLDCTSRRSCAFDRYGVRAPGADPPGAFRQHVRTLTTARDRLMTDAGTTAVDPTVGTGLRGAYGALGQVAQDDAFKGSEVPEAMKKLGGTIDQLDSVRRVGRPYDAADVLRQMVYVMHLMTHQLAPPMAEEHPIPPAPGPTTQPGTEDSPAETQPATTHQTQPELPALPPSLLELRRGLVRDLLDVLAGEEGAGDGEGRDHVPDVDLVLVGLLHLPLLKGGLPSELGGVVAHGLMRDAPEAPGRHRTRV